MTQLSNSGRVEQQVGLAKGNVYWRVPGDDGPTDWTAATNSAAGTPPLNFTGVAQSAPNIELLWYADGTNWVFYNPRTHVVDDWVASAGTLPVDSDNNTPRLICTYFGRTILSGLLLDPQSVFGSAIDDPTDWNYARTTFSAEQAWALTTGNQGVVGDQVTGLCPVYDDQLIIFGNSTLQVVKGDPLFGGSRQFITDKIGGLWGRCWARDPDGRIFFVSNKCGIYVMESAPGGGLTRPQEISQPVKQLLDVVETGDLNISAEYDPKRRGIFFAFSPLSEPGPTTHHFLELRTMAWQPMKFGNHNHDPLTMCVVDGNNPGDRELIFGGWDGFTYKFDDEASKDAGTVIESSCLVGPFLTPNTDVVFIKELQGVLGVDSGEVEYDVLTGETPEEALTSDPVFSGTLSSGRNHTHPIRKSGHVLYINLRSTAKWAAEVFRLVIGTRGPGRQRSKGG